MIPAGRSDLLIFVTGSCRSPIFAVPARCAPRHAERLAEALVEALREIARELEVLLLVGATGISLVEQDVRRLQDRIDEEGRRSCGSASCLCALS